MPVSLAAIKDFLIPGAWILGDEFKRDVDLWVDYTGDSIMARIDGVSHKLLTRKDIDDNTYKADFLPLLKKLLEKK